jgi:dihydrofolate synthase/folylpolyglutamate synthase
LAFLWFREKGTDFVVLEVGLGGRLDATNVLEDPAACLITPVSLEHQDILGKTLAKIAWEKAGILKAGRLAATFQTDPKVVRVIRKRARQVGAPLWVMGPGVYLGSLLPGSFGHQIQNAALAVAGIRLLEGQGIRVGERAIQRGLARMRWPGRLELIRKRPTILLDGAHNPAGAKALSGALQKKYPGKKWIVLNGFLGDKSYGDCVGHLKEQALLSIVTEPPSDRKRPGRGVFETWEKVGVPVLWVKDWRQALGLALAKAKVSGAGLLITGSLYLVGACRGALMGKRGLEKI